MNDETQLKTFNDLKAKWGFTNFHCTLGDDGKNMTEEELVLYLDGVLTEMNDPNYEPIPWSDY